MDDSPAAASVWTHLRTNGCERTHTVHPTPHGTVHRVEIRRHGTVVATGEHAVLSLASSRALLDAVQVLAPPARTPPARSVGVARPTIQTRVG